MEQTVNFVREGEGAPIILIHGLAASTYDWVDLIPALAGAGYCVYALDLLGHGRSFKPGDLNQYHIDRIFEHLDAWIDSLQLEQRPILIGHSLGGYLAIEYALRFPEKVRALVLADTFYTIEQVPPILRFHYKHPWINLGMISYAPKWLIRLAIESGSLFIRNGYTAPQTKSGRAQTADDYKRASPGIYNILGTVRDLTPALPQVMAPALVIWGVHDQSLSPASFTLLADTLPRARRLAMDAGHVPHQSHASEFNIHVLEFLQSLETQERQAG